MNVDLSATEVISGRQTKNHMSQKSQQSFWLQKLLL